MRIYLIRNGEENCSGLTGIGKWQSRLAGDVLSEVPFDVVYSQCGVSEETAKEASLDIETITTDWLRKSIKQKHQHVGVVAEVDVLKVIMRWLVGFSPAIEGSMLLQHSSITEIVAEDRWRTVRVNDSRHLEKLKVI